MANLELLFDGISAFCSVVLAGCACWALKQIYVSKEQIKMQREEFLIKSKREALTIASDQIRYFSNEVIPLMDKVDKIIENEDINFLKQNKVVFEKGELSFDMPEPKKEDIEKLKKNLKELLELTNKMDDFSIYFTSNLADIDFAFSVMGDLFCSEMEKLLPFCFLFDDQRNAPSIQLYIKWKQRIEIDNLKQQQMTIEKRLADYMK